jgi:hypothetical protein
MIKTIFSLFYIISCVNARHLTYATGMDGPHYLRHRHLAYATGIEGPRNLKHSEENSIVYDNYY